MIEKLKPAIFLDRDGVINKEVGYITNLSQLEIFPYIKNCIDKIHEMGYLAIVISNQAAVAKGLISEEDLLALNHYIEELIGVDRIYYCPHHEDGMIEAYRIKCNCRKPNIGMIEKAKADFDIDIDNSYLVGDRASDIETGKNAGIKTILVESGYGLDRLEYEVSPDYICGDLTEAINWIKATIKKI